MDQGGKELVLSRHIQKAQTEEEKVHTHIGMLSPASKNILLQVLGAVIYLSLEEGLLIWFFLSICPTSKIIK